MLGVTQLLALGFTCQEIRMVPSKDAYDVIIIGGGIAGMAAAHKLEGNQVLLAERGMPQEFYDRASGYCGSEIRDVQYWNTLTFSPTTPWIRLGAASVPSIDFIPTEVGAEILNYVGGGRKVINGGYLISHDPTIDPAVYGTVEEEYKEVVARLAEAGAYPPDAHNGTWSYEISKSFEKFFADTGRPYTIQRNYLNAKVNSERAPRLIERDTFPSEAEISYKTRVVKLLFDRDLKCKGVVVDTKIGFRTISANACVLAAGAEHSTALLQYSLEQNGSPEALELRERIGVGMRQHIAMSYVALSFEDGLKITPPFTEFFDPERKFQSYIGTYTNAYVGLPDVGQNAVLTAACGSSRFTNSAGTVNTRNKKDGDDFDPVIQWKPLEGTNTSILTKAIGECMITWNDYFESLGPSQVNPVVESALKIGGFTCRGKFCYAPMNIQSELPSPIGQVWRNDFDGSDDARERLVAKFASTIYHGTGGIPNTEGTVDQTSCLFTADLAAYSDAWYSSSAVLSAAQAYQAANMIKASGC